MSCETVTPDPIGELIQRTTSNKIALGVTVLDNDCVDVTQDFLFAGVQLLMTNTATGVRTTLVTPTQIQVGTHVFYDDTEGAETLELVLGILDATTLPDGVYRVVILMEDQTGPIFLFGNVNGADQPLTFTVRS